MSDLIFEEPTPANRTGSGVSTWVRSLRDHPGCWVKYPTPIKGVGNTAHRIRSGLYSGTMRGEFEAAGRIIDGDGWLFVRYVGAKS